MNTRRDGLRELLLEEARRDPRVPAAAITGSRAAGTEDAWSDIDLFLGVADAPPAEVLETFTAMLYAEHGALHHFDLAAGPATYRAFLLDGPLEVDLGLAPIEHFRAQAGAPFQVAFGAAQPPGPAVGTVDVDHVLGLVWHHLLHARTSIERARPWQAEHWISATRDHLLALASHRLGLPTAYAKGADDLPEAVLGPLAATLVRALTREGLELAYRAVVEAALRELREHDPRVADRLSGPLRQLADHHATETA